MGTGDIERERKFSLETDKYHLLHTVKTLEEYTLGEAKKFHRGYIYFDTENHNLRDNGATVSIRFRPPDNVLTVKIPTRSSLEERRTYESTLKLDLVYTLGMKFPELPNSIIIPELLGVDSKDLRGSLLLDVDNTRIPISRKRFILELDLSQYTGTDDQQTNGTLWEAEVELEESGTPPEFVDFCSRLQKNYSLVEINKNKYQRMRDYLDSFRMLEK